jgi:16S rRNA (cytosine1402-N4)-methyltransferase
MDRPTEHRPVLVAEVVELLAPAGARLLVDCTIGAGGHAEALLDAAGQEARLIGMDVDPRSCQLARGRLRRFGDRVRLFQANFGEIRTVLDEADWGSPDVAVADLGVCSAQLDDPARGLSFQQDGPLDMRLDDRLTETAADLVNRMGEKELADLIYRWGEERFSRRIARAIVERRRREPITRTVQLAELVRSAMPAAIRRSRRGVHPATRTFQALRIAVNDEMGALDRLLRALPEVLAVGGRAGVISFHSLEDRPVKRALAQRAETGRVRRLTKKPVQASDKEVTDNPRSRSAKLRAFERLA